MAPAGPTRAPRSRGRSWNVESLADYSFDLHKSAKDGQGADAKPKHLDALIVSGGGAVESAVADAAIVAAAVNAARDLQNRPGNDLTPTALADYARALGGEIEGLQVEVQGRAGIEGLGMGAFAAVARLRAGAALIVLKYEGGDAKGRCSASSARPSRSTAAASR